MRTLIAIAALLASISASGSELYECPNVRQGSVDIKLPFIMPGFFSDCAVELFDYEATVLIDEDNSVTLQVGTVGYPVMFFFPLGGPTFA